MQASDDLPHVSSNNLVDHVIFGAFSISIMQ